MSYSTKAHRSERSQLAFLTLGHFCTDLNQGALPAILPFLVLQHHFSLAAVAVLVLVSNATSALIQPLLGQLADRYSMPWLAPLGILLAGLGAGLIGIAPNYAGMLLAATVSGIGIAVFHPAGARLVNQIATQNRATGMSIFSVGGNSGFAAGPVFTTACLLWLGLPGTMLLWVPAIAMSLVLLNQTMALQSQVSPMKPPAPGQIESMTGGAIAAEAWKPFIYLTAAIVCRSVIFSGFNTFLPLYWIDVLHQSKAAGSSALTILLVAGVIGTLVGGKLADRYGRPIVVLVGTLALLPVLPLFLSITSVSSATILLVLLGFVLFLPFSVMVVMGQEYLPNRVGVASGVTLGLAISVGGLVAPLLGGFADHHGIHAALGLLVFVSAVAIGLIVKLLDLHRRHVKALAEAV